jgi:hypothetical protein
LEETAGNYNYSDDIRELLSPPSKHLTDKELFFQLIKKCIDHGDVLTAWDLIVVQDS